LTWGGARPKTRSHGGRLPRRGDDRCIRKRPDLFINCTPPPGSSREVR
jgi:hypothetical protein